jgi:hypothetical protein
MDMGIVSDCLYNLLHLLEVTALLGMVVRLPESTTFRTGHTVLCST